jgi:DNA-binding NarL/FixJ family response regulator
MRKRINVLVRHAEPLLGVGLVAALRQQPDFEVFVHGVDEPAGSVAIDVVVADYQAGLALAAGVRRDAEPAARARAKVMVMAMSGREHEIRLALEGGVHGYLLLGCGIEDLAAGVRSLGRGARYLCPAAAQCLAESLAREALTVREADVLRLLALGHSNKAIARDLGIAVGTVKAHVKRILEKLGATTRTEAASIAVRHGLLEVPAPSMGASAIHASTATPIATRTDRRVAQSAWVA